MIPVSEAQISTAIKDYLETLQSMGKILYFRLNSGVFVMGEGKSKRVIRGTKKGTSDFLVLKRERSIFKWCPAHGYPLPCNKCGMPLAETLIFFIEVKTDKTKQNEAQVDFQKQVEAMDFTYKVVRSVDEVISLLGE